MSPCLLYVREDIPLLARDDLGLICSLPRGCKRIAGGHGETNTVSSSTYNMYRHRSTFTSRDTQLHVVFEQENKAWSQKVSIIFYITPSPKTWPKPPSAWWKWAELLQSQIRNINTINMVRTVNQQRVFLSFLIFLLSQSQSQSVRVEKSCCGLCLTHSHCGHLWTK